ncbi:MAG TPA: BsuPI-related putative proteinase inhibitor [Terriglobia bacterium]|nr:BsuPI-related putative proteinase inhibitor [Terriglobia bacterium]
MKSFALLVFMALAVIPADGQGVRLSSDFFPLAVGNRWAYSVTAEDGKKISEAELSIDDHQIIRGRSYYVVSQFPFVADPAEKIRLIGYDREEHEFIRLVNDREDPLFLSDGSTVDTLEQDAGGLPQKIRLHLDLMTLIFQRGVGIVEARIETPAGVRLIRMSDSRVGAPRSSSTGVPAPEPAINPNAARPPGVVSAVTAENPRLSMNVEPIPEGFRMTFTVTNTGDRLLPFRFPSGQNFDFIVMDQSGREVWRWSRTQFFTRVVRSEALRPDNPWRYQAVWDGRDSDGNAAPPGSYRVTAQLVSDPPREAPSVVVTIP